MTERQFRRWRRLSIGLIAAYHATKHRREKLLAETERFFDYLDEYGLWQHMISWDDSLEGEAYACDLFSELFDCYSHWSGRRQYEGRFYSQLSGCIRAGMDVAAEPSAGVIGFTVGDVRRAFRWHLPKWFLDLYPGIGNAPAGAGVWL